MRNEAKGIRKAVSEADNRFNRANNTIALLAVEKDFKGLERYIEMRSEAQADYDRASRDHYNIKQAISKAKHYLD